MQNVYVDIDQLYATMREYLLLEEKFQPRLCLPTKPQSGEITCGARDGSAHVLRCLKMWYDLPPDVLFNAINMLDRFLTKMKVRPCHMSCISVSCMHIAMETHVRLAPASAACHTVSTEDLVSISQCSCTTGDVARMSAIVRDKLGLAEGVAPLTALSWLRLLAAVARWAAARLGVEAEFMALVKEQELVNMLEILACDASCVNIRACELALVLLFTQLESKLLTLAETGSVEVSPTALHELFRVLDFAVELQRICQIPECSVVSSAAAVRGVLQRYDARRKTPHRQRLVWRLSSRTLKVLRPTDRLTVMLPTIEEQQQAAQEATPRRVRSGSESSEDLSEDMKDWPRSPVLPVYCSDN